MVIEDKIYRITEVAKMVGLSSSTIYKLIKQGDFPKQIQLTERSVGWDGSDLKNWIDSKKPINRSEQETI
jgi:prophage regulatory protein